MKPATFAPAYVVFFLPLTEIARKHGYALAAHGSMSTDMDLVAVPWTDAADEAGLIAGINAYASGTFKAMFDSVTTLVGPEAKPHGRVAYCIKVGNAAVIDLSIMPLAKTSLLQDAGPASTDSDLQARPRISPGQDDLCDPIEAGELEQLSRFYGAPTWYGIIRAQDRHIARLQAKVQQLERPLMTHYVAVEPRQG